MAMTHNSPEVLELVQLLKAKFGLPEGCVGFTLTVKIDEVVKLEAEYHPQRGKDAE